MRKKKITQMEEVAIEESVAPVEIEQSIPEVVSDAVLLKIDHTHAGTLYKAGTSIDELNPSESTLEFMKARDII